MRGIITKEKRQARKNEITEETGASQQTVADAARFFGYR